MSKVGRKAYGKIPVNVAGKNAWVQHDATKTWSDAGEVRKVMESATEQLEAIVASNVSLGVLDYAETAEAALRISDSGELFIALRLWNNDASLIVEVPIKSLMAAAVTELRSSLATDPAAQAAMSHLTDLGRVLSLSSTPKQETSSLPRRRPAHIR